jgi:hypothetical protein
MVEQIINSSRQQGQAMGSPTGDINPACWGAFLAEFTRENQGAHGRLQVHGPEIGRLVQIDNQPFAGVWGGIRNGAHAVAISFGLSGQDYFTHRIQNVTAIRARPSVGAAGVALEVVAPDNTTTLLELSKPATYAVRHDSL